MSKRSLTERRAVSSSGHAGSRHAEVMIGITSWNSAAFLAPCLDAIAECTATRARVVVLDNMSTDGSDEIARARGAEVMRLQCSQPEALNRLFEMSRSPYTLLMHADVILLNPRWVDLCLAEMRGSVALVSPEDIGCGPLTRVWGKGMPESSFLLFDTTKARATRRWFKRQRFKIKWPYRALDFSGEHITYNLPRMLATKGYGMKLFDVHPATLEPEPVYTPNFQPKYWGPHLDRLRYGLGNFYSIRGQITHYHNWYDRVIGSSTFETSTEQVPKEGGIPKAWLHICSKLFLDDLASGSVRLPDLAARG